MVDSNSSNSVNGTQKQRVRALDGIRGAAIILVLVWHYVSCQTQTRPGTGIAYAMKCLSYSWAGVDLFFVLSGFLIGGILTDQRSSANYFFPFYVRRACRIFPLYYSVYAVFVVGCAYPTWRVGAGGYLWLFDKPLPIWSYSLHFQNIAMAQFGTHGPNWMGVSWSLAVEEQFYLILPLIVRFLSRSAVGWLSAILVISGPLVRLSLLSWHPNGEIASYVLLPARWDSMFLGVLGAIAIRSPAMCDYLQGRIKVVRLVTLSSAFGIAGLCLMGQGIGSFGMCVLGHSLLAVTSLGLILLSTLSASGCVSRFFANSILVWAGTISYGIYLLHQPISGLMHGYLLNQSPQISNAANASVTILATVTTLGLAVVSSRVLEMPLVKMGHSVCYRT